MSILTGYFSTDYFQIISMVAAVLLPIMTLIGYIIDKAAGRRHVEMKAKFVLMQCFGMWGAAILIGLVIYGGFQCFIT